MSQTLRVSSSYEHALQSLYWDIGIRGIRVDTSVLAKASAIADAEIARNLAIASKQWSCPVFIGAENNPSFGESDEEDEEPPAEQAGGAVNINATQGKYALLAKLKDLGYNIPKITKKNEEGDYEQKDSTGELAIQRMLSENQFNYPGGDPALRAVLKVRELGKLKTSYLNARLLRRRDSDFFICTYNVAGTVTGRRSSRRHPFGFGNNAQNTPKHSSTAGLFRECLVARESQILLFVDQIQAEDWPVNALAENYNALKDLDSGADRHSALASFIMQRRIPAKGDPDWDEAQYGMYRFVGKKARHANNYGMEAPRFADVLAQELPEFYVPIGTCKAILEAVDKADPQIKGVFHAYVRAALSSERILRTPAPFLRERQFLSVRPTESPNSQRIKEAFAFIPQSTVADNTGFAILDLEANAKGAVIQEGHDSVVQDIPDTYDSVYKTLCTTRVAFDRFICFHNGIKLNIPIEAEVGYNFKDTVKIKAFTLAGVKEAMDKLRENAKRVATFQVAVGA